MKKRALFTLIFLFAATGFTSVIASPGWAKQSLHEKESISVIISDKKSGNGTIIRAKGVGLPPSRAKRPAQTRLLARRAAIVDAYRNLLRAFDDMSGYISNRRKYVVEKGFIKGVRILDEKTYPDGKVEVEVGLVVDLKGRSGLRKVKRAGYEIVYQTYEIKRPYRVITKEEWMELRSE